MSNANWTIEKKLITSFVGVSIITLIIGIIGIMAVRVLDHSLTEIADVRLPSVQSLLIISEAQTAVDAGENALLAVNATPDQRESQFKRFENAFKRSEEAFAIYKPLPMTVEEEQVWKEFEPAWESWIADHKQYATLAKAYWSAPSPEIYAKLSHQALVVNGASFAKAESLLNKLISINAAAAELSQKQSKIASSTAFLLTSIFTLFAVILALILGITISRGINGSLRSIVKSLSSGSDQVASASEELSASSQMLSQGVTEQAASLEEISSSVEELSAMTQQNAGNSKEANSLGKTADQAGSECIAVVKNMAVTMEEIKSSSDKTAQIIKTIDEIAMQTNLLALNAAIEAARAGEAGRGFAVVAEEVRNLALRSAEAAKSTSELIDGMQGSSKNGVTVAIEVESSIAGIAKTVAQMSQLLSEVSSGSIQQADGLEQISSAINQLEQVTQSAAANSEETASAGEELSAQAQVLAQIVNQLNVMVEGESALQSSQAMLYRHRNSGYAGGSGLIPM